MADVELRNISKSFGPVKVIKGIDLKITDGEFVVFVGPSGCGKSTLLRMIAGLEDISDGELWIDGRICNDIAAVSDFRSQARYPRAAVPTAITAGSMAKDHSE